jgi:O-antigen ligase
MLNLFTRTSTDTSIQARVQDYELVPEFLARHPILGRGYFTHSPSDLLLDNSYLGTLIELGVVGGIIVFAFLLALTIRPVLVFGRAHGDEAFVLLSALLGGVTLLLAMATFDALKFAQFLPTCLVLLGLGTARVDAMTAERESIGEETNAADHQSESV